MQKIRLYKSKALFVLFITGCVLLAAFIFLMSSEPAAVSGGRSGGIVEWIAPIFFKDFDKLPQLQREELLSRLDHIIRKIAHFCIYATLGALLALAFFYFEKTYVWHVAIPLLCGALYAAGDEIHQYFVPGRGPLFSDVVLDSSGVLCGALVIMIFACIIRKIKATRN